MKQALLPAGEKIKVGLSFSDFATERWKNEEVLMRKLLEEKGYEVLSQEANHDVKLQNDQIDNMVSQGVKAPDRRSPKTAMPSSTAVDKAADAGVKVIAYDRLIKTPKIAAYLSFNNVEVGRQQALGVMKAVDIENWDVAGKGKVRLVKLGGSPTDNNAILFRKGQDEILDQYEDKLEDRGRPVGGQLGCGQRPEADGEHPDRARQRGRRGGRLERRHRAGRAAGDEGAGSGRQGADLGPGRHRRWLQQHRQG